MKLSCYIRNYKVKEKNEEKRVIYKIDIYSRWKIFKINKKEDKYYNRRFIIRMI